MAVIGSAYVQIKAITTGLEKDISSKLNKAFNDVKFDARKAVHIDPPDTSGVQKAYRDIEQGAERSSKKAGDSFIHNFGKGQISYLIRRIFYLIVWGTPIVGTLIGVLAQLGGAFLSLASAIGPAISALGVVPGLLAAAGTAGISLVAAFAGISKAYSAGTKKMAAGGGGATKAATNNAKQIRDAQQAVARAVEDAVDRQASAERDLADSYESAAEDILKAQRSVRDAENGLAEALAKSRAAQEGVNAARAEAIDQLIELGFNARQAAISEGTAAIALERAREKLAEVVELPVNHRLRKEAQLAYDQAQLNLDEAIKGNQDAAKASTDAQQKGVEGSDLVVEAKNSEVDANNEVMKSQEELADSERDLAKTRIQSARDIQDAQKNLSDTMRDNARSIQDAQERLADAMAKTADAAGGGAGGVDAFARAMDQLGPSAQAFVRYLLSIQGVFKGVREAAGSDLFPRLQQSIEAIISGGFLDVLSKGLQTAGRAIGDVAIKFSDLLNNPFFSGNLATIFASNETVIGNLGSALISIVDLFVAIAAAAAPFTEELAKWVNFKIGGWAKDAQDNFGGLQDKIATGVEVFKRLMGIFNDVKDAIQNLMDAAKPAGDTLIDAFAGAAQHFKDFTDANPGRLQAFFDIAAQSAMSVGDLLRDAVNLMFRLGEGDAGKSITAVVDILRNEALPAIDDLFTKLSASGTSEAIAHLFSGMIEALSQILDSGALNTFIGIIQGAIDALSSLSNIPGFPAFVTLLGTMIGAWKGLSLVAQVTGIRTVGTAISETMPKIKTFKDTLVLHQALGTAGGDVSKFGATLSALGSTFPKTSKALSLFGDGFGKLGAIAKKNPLITIAVVLATLAGAFLATSKGQEVLTKAMEGLGKIIDPILKALEPLGDLFSDIFGQIGEALAPVFELLGGAFSEILSVLIPPLSELMSVLGDAFMGILMALMPLIQAFADILVAMLPALLPLIDAVLALVQPFLMLMVPLTGIITSLLPPLISLLLLVLEPITKLAVGIATALVPAIDLLSQGIKIVGDWITKAIDWFTAFVESQAETGSTFMKIWNGIISFFTTVINAIRNTLVVVVDGIKQYWAGAWQAISAAASIVWSAIQTVVRNGIAIVQGIIRTVTQIFSGDWAGAWNTIQSTATTVWNNIKNFFSGAVADFGRLFSGMASAISAPFKTAFNSIASFWNSTVGNLKFDVPAWVPGLGGKSFALPKIPMLAAGGTIAASNGGTLAMLAEAGRDERVTPLNANGLTDGESAIIEALNNFQGAGNTVNITVVAQPGMDIQTLAREVSRQIVFLGA